MTQPVISVAPMMDWTDRHCRSFHRLIAPHVTLYTEMVTAPAIQYGNREKLLGFDAPEKPLVLQLGGSDPAQLAAAARVGEVYGYTAINLNCGCPSDRVQNGAFGACMMERPVDTADCIAAMQDAVSIPVTVKSRIGIDHQDSYQFLCDFVGTIAARGCNTFIIHARKAWLSGLSPRENREVPPLDYNRVYQLKKDFPSLSIHINGGIQTLDEIKTHLAHVDGVMIGREAYQNPFILQAINVAFYDGNLAVTRADIVNAYIPYIEDHLQRGVKLSHITRHMLGLYHGQRGGRHFRRVLTEQAHCDGAGIDVIIAAMQHVT